MSVFLPFIKGTGQQAGALLSNGWDRTLMGAGGTRLLWLAPQLLIIMGTDLRPKSDQLHPHRDNFVGQQSFRVHAGIV
jgi:hypothetical protein